ncbi:MAG: tetratricopeptide repeat protein [Clostridium sp.]
MLTIGLDESGQFKNDNNLSFIGGILYNSEDFKEEEKRLKNFLMGLHKKIEVKFFKNEKFPSLLHSTDNNREMNKLISEEVILYLKENKNYKLAMFIKDNETSIKENSLGNLIDMKDNTNIYTLMANLFIYNSVFYSLREEKDINLNLATRSFPEYNTSEIKKYMEKGYGKTDIKRDGREGHRFYITNADTYRGAITEKVMNEFKGDGYNFNINVEMINYNKYDKREGESSPFLYLADAICGYLREIIRDFKIQDAKELIRKETEKECEIFYYTDVHFDWIELNRGLKEKDIIKVLEKAYKIKENKDKKAGFYYGTWVKKVLKNLDKVFEVESFDIYNEKIKYLLSTRGCDYGLAEYIIENLIKIVEEKDMRKEEILFKLYSRKLAICNHKGYVDKGEEILEKLRDLREFADLNEYIEVLNRSVNIEINACDYEEAIERLKEIEEYYGEILNAYNLIGEFEGIKRLNLDAKKSLGKVKSTLGQAYSFNKDYERAIEEFNEAKNLFKEEREKERVIGYEAHLYIEKGEEENFNEYLISKYNKKDLAEILEDTIKKDRIDSFEIFLLLKGMYKFQNDIDPEKIHNLIRNEKLRENLKLKEHPGELISKYICFLMIKSNNKQIRFAGIKFLEENYKEMKDISFTIKLIKLKSKLQINKIEEINIKDLKKEILDLKKEIKNNKKTEKIFNKIFEVKEENFEEILKVLEEKVTYTYN